MMRDRGMDTGGWCSRRGPVVLEVRGNCREIDRRNDDGSGAAGRVWMFATVLRE